MSIRNKISGTPERPRLSVFRSNTNIFAQLIDDVNGVTLVSASTIDKALKGSIANGGNVEAAKAVGKAIAERAEAYKPKERVTYKMIKEYIEAKYGFKVHTAYIAEVKRDLGLPMYDAPNVVEELKHPRKHPTAEKVEAIKDALKHFEVI